MDADKRRPGLGASWKRPARPRARPLPFSLEWPRGRNWPYDTCRSRDISMGVKPAFRVGADPGVVCALLFLAALCSSCGESSVRAIFRDVSDRSGAENVIGAE